MTLRLACERLMEARDVDGLLGALTDATGQLSCKWFSGFLSAPGARTSADKRSFGRIPTSYRTYHNDSAFQRDPVVKAARSRRGLPIAWAQQDYVASDCSDLWEEMASHGMARGLAVMSRTADGYEFAFGIESDVLHPESQKVGEIDQSRFALLMAYTQVATERIFIPQLATRAGGCRGSARPAVAGSSAALSQRQREVLKWTAAGKTAWEVGRILAISEGTVRRHLQDAAQTLNAVNKAHAVAMALEFGWI